jgi:glycosyltransferase involved in cell wall biosynthesis
LAPKIVFVVDIRGHAFDFIAKTIKIEGDVTTLYWSDFTSVKMLTKKLEELRPDLVHFFWRKQLELVFQDLKMHSRKYSNLARTHFTFSVPDHLYSDDSELIESFELFENASSYIVTSKKLLDIYQGKFFIPAPYGIIHDKSIQSWPALQERNPNKPLKVLWVGNSKWGEWIGARDHKGLNSVILPAIEMANREEQIVDFKCIDSSVKKYSHQEVLDQMKNADVILQFSETEGTGLPLLEGVLHGAIPITSDVGIAMEFIPASLKDFSIIQRDPNILSGRLKFLHENPDNIKKMRPLAHQAAVEFMLSAPNAWEEFIDSTLKGPAPARFKGEIPGRAKSFINSIRVRLLGQKTRKLGKAFVGVFPALKSSLIKVYLTLQKVNEKDFSLTPRTKVETLAIYCPRWAGVSNSTKNIFENTFPIPHLSSIEPDYPTDKQIDIYANFLLDAVTSRLFISGGDRIHIELAKKIKQLNPSLDIRFLWHGGIALMPNSSEGQKFEQILDLHKQGVISGIDSVKPGFPDLLRKLDVDSNLFVNYINFNKELITSYTVNKNDNDAMKVVGVFASSLGWWKNYWNQYFVLRALDNVRGVVLFQEDALDEIFEFQSMNPQALGYISDKQSFSTKLSELDILLYVTFVECSPMLPLEAMSFGVITIVGPSTEYISGSPLEEYLMVRNPDSPSEILEKVEFALLNHDLIRNLQFEFLQRFTREAKQSNSQVIGDLEPYKKEKVL